ncbi:mesothelin-like [Neomonachus schauinslandi]|uniref:Mesothelin n=1 Tax=Neomonachus schauinslandi TaxID=29088 RepID=A0A2Y9HPZ4_NEOSC|nr:mesothelin [Neomonachus schauinslandi]XP_044768067.1 mesothelin-like [Neomonachus schauinslandi]
MALQTAQPLLGSCGTSAHGNLLLLLLSLGWVFPSRAQAADSRLGVMTPWLQGTSRDLSWQQPELTVVLLRDRRDTEKKVCLPERKAHVIDENLVFYEEWELEACVDGALLAAQVDRVNMVPFTYQQLNVFKRKLDEFYPQGYPESLIQHLRYFFLELTPADIHRWNVTSLETVKSLLQVSKGQTMDAQVAALIARYVAGGGQLDKASLDTLATFGPTYLCFLSPEQLGSVQPSVLWAARPQDLEACRPPQMDILYPRARAAFQNISGSEYFMKIKPYLAGAPTEDLRALSHQKVNMDTATFKTLQTEAVLPLTIAEVQNLLGPNLVGLKAEQESSPVRDWILRQRQDNLESLGLGLHGGIPNGYLVMDLSFREALSGGARLLGPGPVLIAIPTLLLALIPK